MASHWLAVALVFGGEPLASPIGPSPRVLAAILYDCQLFFPSTLSCPSYATCHAVDVVHESVGAETLSLT